MYAEPVCLVVGLGLVVIKEQDKRPRRVVITGVSRGLGLAMTQGLIAGGHHVFGCVRSPEVADSLNHRFGPPHNVAVVDVTDEGAVKAWAEAVTAGGVPDLLINNAAIVNHLAPLWQVPAAEFSQLIDINIKGVANVLRHFLPSMVARQQGIIVNLSSGWGRSTSPQVAPYCASKWAIEGLTQSLAQELPPGMAAIPLNPGIIHTDMLEICYGEEAAAYTAIADWAKQAVPFLLSLTAADNGIPQSVPSGGAEAW